MTLILVGKLAQEYIDLLEKERKLLAHFKAGTVDDHDGFMTCLLGNIQEKLTTIRKHHTTQGD